MRVKNKRIMMKGRIIIALLMIAVCLACISSCNKDHVTNLERVEGKHGYRHVPVSLSDDPSYSNQIIMANRVENTNYALEVSDRAINASEMERILTLYSFDDEGNVLQKTLIDTDLSFFGNIAAMRGKELVIPLSDGTIVLIDSVSGKEITRTSPDGMDDLVWGVVPVSEGIVVIREGRMTLYNDDLEQMREIRDSNITWLNNNSFFEEDGKYYAVLDGNYYSADFTKGSVEKVMSIDDLPITYPEPYGKNAVGTEGLFEVSIGGNQIKTLADFNYVDIKPESRVSEHNFFCLDDTHFVKTYSYISGGAELDLYIYDNSIDNSSKEQIVIGGYGVQNDLIIKQIVYRFNTSHDDYRIILEDYSKEYGWDNGEEAQASLLKLMQYFNSGHTPDIFYGDAFDYEYFGRNSMVCDIMPYLNNSGLLKDIYPSIASTVTSKDHCYSLFACYQMDGYWGLRENLSDPKTSFEDLISLSRSKGIKPFNSKMAYDIADSAIRYPLDLYIDRMTEENVLSSSDLKLIIDASIEYGAGTFEELQNSSPLSMTEGEVMTERSFIANIYTYYGYSLGERHKPLRFLGFPAIGGSVHGIQVNGLCAIAESSDKKDICWEVIQSMFNDEIQENAVSNGYIPVCVDVLDKALGYASDPESIPDNEVLYREFIGVQGDNKPVPSEVISEYKEALDQIDTVISYDWGIFNIVHDEVCSHYTQNKSSGDIVTSLGSRLDLYVKENYR